MRKNIYRALFLAVTTLAISSCGGGGGSGSGGSGGSPSTGSGTGTGSGSGGTTSAMTMSCAEGTGFQCSGSDVLARENGIALTRSGVQVYGRSATDDVTDASGLTLTGLSGSAKADIRVGKSGSTVSSPKLLLSNLGISWDGINDRPLIIDTFNATQGRSVLNADGTVRDNVSLPSYTDLNFYDYATRAKSATQANYANNRYFPRNEASRCDSGPCPTSEIQVPFGTNSVDNLSHAKAVRLHEDGDIHAGDGPNGTILAGGSGHGVPYPGSKGYRSFESWSLEYANLAGWVTGDTVSIAEWLSASANCSTTRCDEHNQNRRGMVAFGDVTAPASVPTSGTVTYTGTAYGWASGVHYDELDFSGTNVTVVVNYASGSRVVTATITGLPSGTLTVNATLGAAGSDRANYFTGASGSNGLSGRLFGPSSTEVAGVFSLPGSSAVIGGFIARRQ